MSPLEQDLAVLRVLRVEPAIGNAGLASQTGLSVSTAKRTRSRLVAGGVLEVVASGRGRGSHTEFRVVSEGHQKAGQEAGQEAGQSGSNDGDSSRTRVLALDLTQVQEQPPKPPSGLDEPEPVDDGKAADLKAAAGIAKYVFDERHPRPSLAVHELEAIALRLLRLGWTDYAIRRAAMQTKVFTVNGFEYVLNDLPKNEEPTKAVVPFGNPVCGKCQGRGSYFGHDGFVHDCKCVDPALRKRREATWAAEARRRDEVLRNWDDERLAAQA